MKLDPGRFEVVYVDVDKSLAYIDLLCDVNYLPFRPRSFDIVNASNVLNHLENPIQTIMQLRMASNHLVILKVPNASFYRWKPDSWYRDHLFSWNEYTFQSLLVKFFPKVRIQETERLMRVNPLFNFLRFVLRLFYGAEELTAICEVARAE